jgi:hypothetical protein
MSGTNQQTPDAKSAKTTKRRHKTQEEKLEVEREEARQVGVQHMQVILAKAKRNVAFFHSNHCDPLRNFLQHYEANRGFFRARVADSAVFDGTAPMVEEMPSLDTSFINSLVDSTFNADGNVQPIVQVVDVQISYEDQIRAPGRQRRVRFTVTDGSNKTVVAIGANNILEDVRRQLLRGNPIIRLRLFHSLHYSRDGSRPVSEDNPVLPGIVIQRYDFLCLPVRLIERDLLSVALFSEPVQTEQPNHQHQAEPRASNLDGTDYAGRDPTTEFHRKIVEFQGSSEFQHLPDESILFCSSEYPECSKYGIRFQQCIAESSAVDGIGDMSTLQSYAETCHFVTREVANMPNNEKRNLLYWYFATNYYSINGSKSRSSLPSCLVCAIRMAHPNPKGKEYVGFKSRKN